MNTSVHVSNSEKTIYRKLKVLLKMRREHCAVNDPDRLTLESQITELFRELDDVHGEAIEPKAWLQSMATLEAANPPRPTFCNPVMLDVPPPTTLKIWRQEAEVELSSENNEGNAAWRLIMALDALEALESLAAKHDIIFERPAPPQ